MSRMRLAAAARRGGGGRGTGHGGEDTHLMQKGWQRLCVQDPCKLLLTPSCPIAGSRVSFRLRATAWPYVTSASLSPVNDSRIVSPTLHNTRKQGWMVAGQERYDGSSGWQGAVAGWTPLTKDQRRKAAAAAVHVHHRLLHLQADRSISNECSIGTCRPASSINHGFITQNSAGRLHAAAHVQHRLQLPHLRSELVHQPALQLPLHVQQLPPPVLQRYKRYIR